MCTKESCSEKTHDSTTGEDGSIPKCKPFKYTYEKEIVMYAHFKKLDYFSTEFVRDFIKDLEQIRPRAILDIIRSGSSNRGLPKRGINRTRGRHALKIDMPATDEVAPLLCTESHFQCKQMMSSRSWGTYDIQEFVP